MGREGYEMGPEKMTNDVYVCVDERCSAEFDLKDYVRMQVHVGGHGNHGAGSWLVRKAEVEA